MSFRFKTILGIASIEAVLLLILIGYSLNILKTSNEEELLKRTYITARFFASSTRNDVLATDLASIESIVRDMLKNPDIVYVRVRGKNNVLAEGGDPKELSKPFIPNKHLEDARDDVFNVYADIVVAGEKYGNVEMGFSISAINKIIKNARSRTLAIAFIEMGLVALFSFVFGLYLTKGLDKLKQASKEIAEGGFGYQVKISGRDELAQTATAFNDMSYKLKEFCEERNRVTEQLTALTNELKHQSLHDSLTKLPNRTLFNDRLEQAILIRRREKQQFAIIILDLDNFKEINDSMGHYIGDIVLQEVATRLRSTLRAPDTVARMGGDEFAIILLTVNNLNGAHIVIQKILNAIKEPFEIAEQTIIPQASVGIAMFPEHGEDIDILMRRADAAMYAAKRKNSGFMVYDATLDKEISDYLTMKTELGNAIFSNELTLHYQPKIDLTTEKIIGVEALIRWQHPKHGLLFPERFIPLAEQSGLIKQLTLQMIKMVLSDCEKCHKSGFSLPVSVNISAINLQDPAFPGQIAEILNNYSIPPSMLEIEITETAIMIDPHQTIETITRLSGLGVQIVIDNFGTGYSSMAYLRKLTVAKIKIDKSFVRNLIKEEKDSIIVRAAIDLGHNLGLKVLAEGVENQAIWKRLKELGCDSAQGFHLSRPLTQDKLMEWMQQAQLKRNT